MCGVRRRFVAAGASIKNLPAGPSGSNLEKLTFRIGGYPGVAFDDFGGTSHGDCNAGAPRFASPDAWRLGADAAERVDLGAAPRVRGR